MLAESAQIGDQLRSKGGKPFIVLDVVHEPETWRSVWRVYYPLTAHTQTLSFMRADALSKWTWNSLAHDPNVQEYRSKICKQLIKLIKEMMS